MDKLLEKIPAKYANIANVAIVAASIFVGYLVIEGGYNKVRAESDSYIKNYGEAKTAESRYNSLKENHDKYKDSVAVWNKAMETVIPAKEGPEDVAVYIQNIVKNLSLSNVKMEKSQAGNVADIIIFKGSFDCQNSEVEKFTKGVENNKRPLELVNLNIVKNGDLSSVTWEIEARRY